MAGTAEEEGLEGVADAPWDARRCREWERGREGVEEGGAKGEGEGSPDI